MKLEGKVALVTGSSQGIGQGIVLRLAQEGAKVVINYRSHPEGAEETLEKVKAIGGNCYVAKCYAAECPNESSNPQGYTVQADLGNVAEIRQLIAESIAHFGQLDILVNNAGIEKHCSESNFNHYGQCLKSRGTSGTGTLSHKGNGSAH